jgi:hypothetical protein
MSESATNENHHSQGRKKGQSAPIKQANTPDSSGSEMVEETKPMPQNTNGNTQNSHDDLVK